MSALPGTAGPLLSVRDLRVSFDTVDGTVKAVDGVTFDVAAGEVLGVVGESGSGKSVTFLTVLRLLDSPAARITGEVLFRGRDLLTMSDEELRAIRGAGIAMVFQDPMTSLHPFYKVGAQIAEAILAHEDVGKDKAWERAVELLDRVGIPQPRERAAQFPHEFSGGMRQRAMIAMALVLNPALLIADEPTTALDVTVQAQILDLIGRLRNDFDTAVVLITHDLGIVAEHADRINVMYAGRIVESGTRDHLFYGSHHPYAWGLLRSISRLDEEVERLRPIEGSPPSLIDLPSGCTFHPRCPYVFDRCRTEIPPLMADEPGHLSACHLSLADKERHFASEVRR
jgi:peptide/nickel transport system ATP-binding protein